MWLSHNMRVPSEGFILLLSLITINVFLNKDASSVHMSPVIITRNYAASILCTVNKLTYLELKITGF